MQHHLRIARPVSNIERTTAMYCQGLALRLLGSFKDHDGFDGVMLGYADMAYHFEFTRCRTHSVYPRPTPEDILVFYITDSNEWQAACNRMSKAGFIFVSSFNPYWERQGKTFEDPDGYRVVLHNTGWRNNESQ